LLASYELEDFADLRPDKIDSFALGAVIYELLMCKQLQDLSADQTLAQCISDAGMETAMTLGHMMLPWLPPNNSNASLPYVGYSHELKNLVMKFLEPNSNERLLPCQMQESLRNDPLSPLQLPHVCAAKTAKPGDPITIDNIQLGMVS
jgi:serine/threonine protein kinase